MVTGTEQLSDEELVARLLQRDTAAFAQLYDRHSRMAFGLAYRLLGEPTGAEDVVQEAFLSVWRQAASFRPERSAVRTWLLSIVHHRAIDRLRRSSTHEITDGAIESLPERADESVDVAHEVALSIDGERVRAALATLPGEQRQAIELAYFGGYSHSEIARMLAIPAGTVKGRLRIGLQKLRALLDQPGLTGVAHDT